MEQQHQDEQLHEHHKEEAVFALFDTVTSGVDLPAAAHRFFEKNPGTLHEQLDELLTLHPEKVIALVAQRLKARYPV